MDVSIIIVNYRSADLIIDCVRAVKEKTEGVSYEIIVVDNASGDDSVKMLQKVLGEEIRLVCAGENLGFGKANNLGAKYAQGTYLFFLNPDTILINNAVAVLVKYLRENPKTGIAGGNLYSIDGRESSSYCLEFDDMKTVRRASGWGNIIWEQTAAWVRRHVKNEEQLRTLAYKETFNSSGKPLEVAYIFGTDMMLSRNLFQEVKGFDPDFFMYAEEEELSWRISQKGWKIVSVPEAKIIHLDGGTFKHSESLNSQQYEMRLTGIMVYYTKRYGHTGASQFYHYKMLRLKRQNKLAKLLNRGMLAELTENQIACLEKVGSNVWRQGKTGKETA